MKAQMVIKIVNSQTNRWELRAGEKGKGKVLAAGTYWPDSGKSCDWPDSGKSCEMRDRQISEICKRDGIEIVGEW